MARISRRLLLTSASAGAAGLATADALAQSPDPPARKGYNPAAMSAAISDRLFSDDGLARPISHSPTVSNLAKGLDRTLILGGGGEYDVAWYCGFFHGLLENGVDPNIAEMVVGTSAGAYAGSSDLEATGTKGMLIIAGTPKGVNPLDPKQIEPALRA